MQLIYKPIGGAGMAASSRKHLQDCHSVHVIEGGTYMDSSNSRFLVCYILLNTLPTLVPHPMLSETVKVRYVMVAVEPWASV